MSALATSLALVTGLIIGAGLQALRRRRDELPEAAMQLARVRIDASGLVLQWRGADVELFGYTAAEMIGRNVTTLMPGHVADEHDSYVRRYVERLQQQAHASRVIGITRLVRGQHRAGHLVSVLLFVRPLRRHGAWQFEGVLHALPREGSSDATTIAEQRAPEVSWRWLRNFGHEVRTPMAAILGHAEILTDPGSAPGERQASACAVLGNSRHLMELLNDLLDHARVAAGRQALRADRINVRELLREVAAMVRPHAEHKGLALQMEVDDAVPPTMHGDALRIRQILLNLLGNAMKFTDTGFVRIELAARGAGRRAMLRLEVADSGRGIDAGFAEHLFEPFQQEQRTQSGLQGTGLGLSIGRRLARLMGGELSLVDSVPGAGARFRLEVPMIGEAVAAVDDGVDRPTAAAAAPPTISRRPASSTIAPLAGVRVLLVDDARDLLLMSRRFLESAGATVTPFDQPLVALEAVAAGAQFDSAVLDLRMPELTGYELAQRLRALGYSGPLMAVSADDDSQVLARCAEAGIYRLIGKPFRREDLIAAVCAGWAEHTARATVVAK